MIPVVVQPEGGMAPFTINVDSSTDLFPAVRTALAEHGIKPTGALRLFDDDLPLIEFKPSGEAVDGGMSEPFSVRDATDMLHDLDHTVVLRLLGVGPAEFPVVVEPEDEPHFVVFTRSSSSLARAVEAALRRRGTHGDAPLSIESVEDVTVPTLAFLDGKAVHLHNTARTVPEDQATLQLRLHPRVVVKFAGHVPSEVAAGTGGGAGGFGRGRPTRQTPAAFRGKRGGVIGSKRGGIIGSKRGGSIGVGSKRGGSIGVGSKRGGSIGVGSKRGGSIGVGSKRGGR
jgi:hypothetical protein